MPLPPFERARLLVAGDLMLDRYWHGGTSRISPEAPVPVVRVSEVEERPGGAGNVALNIASLGAQVTLVANTGADEAATALEQRLGQAGVSCSFARQTGFQTITKLRVLSRHQQLIRLDFEAPPVNLDAAGALANFTHQLEEAQVVILSDYGKGTLGRLESYVQAARAAGRPVLVDPKGRDYSIYRGASLLTPNLSEFEAVVGPCAHDGDLRERGERLRRELELEALLITLSERGMLLLQEGKDPVHLPARAREVFDVTGAGDTVIAVLGTGLAAGLELVDAASLANLAAGLVVAKLGAATVTVSELRRAQREREENAGEPMDEEGLLELVQDARAHGERIVMTNGCFDILHAGHVAYLKQARRLGDRLIVAVNDDDSVRRLKGNERPLNPLAQRMQVLAALEAVDWVVPFSEDTPARIISRILPDVLVKGGDYRPDQIAGADAVVASGGQVLVLDYVDGFSTTRLVESIRNR